MKTAIYLSALAVLSTGWASCSKVVPSVLFKNPRVYSTREVIAYKNKKAVDTAHYYFYKMPYQAVTDSFLFKVIPFTHHIFNKDGYRMMYKGSLACGGDIVEEFLSGHLDNFVVDSTLPGFDHYYENMLDERMAPLTRHPLEQYDYVILNSWNQYFAPKLWFRDQINWLDTYIRDRQITNVVFYKLNSDFLDHWGYQKGKKGKRKVVINKQREAAFTITRYPKLAAPLDQR